MELELIDTFIYGPLTWTKVVIILVALTAIHEVYLHFQFKYLCKKYGAVPAFYFSDYFFGFITVFRVVRWKSQGLLVESFEDRIQFYNRRTLMNKLGGVLRIITNEPENIKAILSTQFDDFTLGTRHGNFYPLLGDGIFTLDHEGWKLSRAMLRPQFVREQVAQIQMLEPHIQYLFQHIRKEHGQKFDLQKLLLKLTMDTATEFLFGESVDSLADESIGVKTEISPILPLKQKFTKSFNEAQTMSSTRTVFFNLYFLIDSFKYRRNCKDVHDFADYFVNKALATSATDLDEKSKGGYVFLYELVKQTRNPLTLRYQALNILLAGRDTTAAAMSFVFYELARNPRIWSKLRQEVIDAFGEGKEARLEEITFESLKKCEYLKAVVNETLRVYPSVPINFRVANKHTTLPRGGGPDESQPIFIRKGMPIAYSVSSTHRIKSIYGEDSNVFRPERWFEPECRKLGWAYLPFNGGPRICLGQQFALTEISYVTCRILQEFQHIESFASDTYPPKKNFQLTMCLSEGVNIALY